MLTVVMVCLPAFLKRVFALPTACATDVLGVDGESGVNSRDFLLVVLGDLAPDRSTLLRKDCLMASCIALSSQPGNNTSTLTSAGALWIGWPNHASDSLLLSQWTGAAITGSSVPISVISLLLRSTIIPTC